MNMLSTLRYSSLEASVKDYAFIHDQTLYVAQYGKYYRRINATNSSIKLVLGSTNSSSHLTLGRINSPPFNLFGRINLTTYRQKSTPQVKVSNLKRSGNGGMLLVFCPSIN